MPISLRHQNPSFGSDSHYRSFLRPCFWFLGHLQPTPTSASSLRLSGRAPRCSSAGLGTLRSNGVFPCFNRWKEKALLSVRNFTKVCNLPEFQTKVKSCFPDTKSFSLLEHREGKESFKERGPQGDAPRDQGRPGP